MGGASSSRAQSACVKRATDSQTLCSTRGSCAGNLDLVGLDGRGAIGLASGVVDGKPIESAAGDGGGRKGITQN